MIAIANLIASLKKFNPYVAIGVILLVVAVSALILYQRHKISSLSKDLKAATELADTNEKIATARAEQINTIATERNAALQNERKARQREKEILNVDPALDGPCAAVLCSDGL